MATMSKQHNPGSAELSRIAEARHHDPFAVLGAHEGTIRLYLPHTTSVQLTDTGAPFNRVGGSDFFEWHGDTATVARPIAITRVDQYGASHHEYDPYSFPPSLSDFDIHLFNSGRHWHLYRILGAHPCTIEGVSGIRFATWAPNAERISVIGNFNQWDGRRHPMRIHGSSGVWELFIPGMGDGELYKFEIRNRHSGAVVQKSDPYGQRFELRPNTAALTYQSNYTWGDSTWLGQREERHWLRHPISIYEVHLSSWQCDELGGFLGYRELAERLVSYVKQLGFTHIELLPITEHPLDDSWGYQTTGYFAPTSRFGTPDDFRYFVDYCHQHHIGVYLDWVPAHFPKDAHALANFDGSALYEHADPRQGEHPDWGTLIYNFGRNEVKNFLLASANFWLEEFHIDGLRVDAVASMLYLDYSREGDNWIPNIHGGNENLEAIAFLRELNILTHSRHPGTVVMAEESTAWPQVTRPVELGGLGFSMKWNMGWMHDTLGYLAHDPIHRSYHHDQLTFGLLYLFAENFILPFSHDEVVHGKGSMLNKMPGDEWQRFANLRLLYTYFFTYPGKKLLFMGCEFGQGSEWNFKQGLDWHLLDYPYHQGIQRLVTDLNQIYLTQPVLHRFDFEPQGFEWIDCHDSSQSVLSYLRKDESGCFIIILNFTPMVHHDYRIGVPHGGEYRESLNSDSSYYQGSNTGNNGVLMSEEISWMGRPHSLSLTLPPLGALILKWCH
jgi:1,4-alpha-glucan branching enzyme